MEFHPKSAANFLAIRKDLYASAPGGRLYRTRIPSASEVTSSSLTSLGSLSSSSGNVTYQSQHETRYQLLQVSAKERLEFDIFGSPLHGSVGSDVVSSPERLEGLRHVDCCDEDGNTEDDEENPRLYIDHHLAECKYNNNCQQQQQHSTSLECLECGKGFASKAVLSRHLRTHSTSTNNIPTSPQPTATWRFQCSLCDSVFERQDELSLHEQQTHFLHNNSTASRSRHVSHTNSNTVHSTTAPTVGGGSLTQPQSDGSKTVYECEQPGCLRHYTSYSSFMKHRKTHMSTTQQAAVSSSDTRVSTCGAVSPTDSKRHSGEKKFQCGQCSKRFPTSKDLKRHDVVHTGNREFQCSFCSHRFGRKDHRMRHEKKTHAAELSPPNPPQPQQQVQQQQPTQLTQPQNSGYKKSCTTSSPPQTNHPSSPSRHASSPVLLQQQDQLVVQRQPQWSRRALTPPLPSPHGLKLEHYMDTIDEDSTLSPLMEDDSMSERKPLDLQKILCNETAEDGLQTLSTPTSNGTVPLDEMTLTSEDADDDCCDDVKSGLDWIITEFMSEDDLPKINDRVGVGRESSSRGFYSPEEVVKPEPVSDPYQVPTSSMSAASPSPKESEMVFGDFLTRTKNPVLPSVYVDNSQPLIMPEPSKQRYQSSVVTTAVTSPRSLLLEENEDDFMADVDVFLREKDIFSNI